MFENLNLGNLGEMFSQMQEKAREMQESSESERYEAKSGGGMVKAIASGRGEIIDLEFDDSLLSDKESLQVLLIAAINDAIAQSEEGKRQAAMKMMGNLGNLANFGK